MHNFSKSIFHGIKHVSTGKTETLINNSSTTSPSNHPKSNHNSLTSAFHLNPYTAASNELKRFFKPSVINKPKGKSAPLSSSSDSSLNESIKTTDTKITHSYDSKQTKRKI